MQDMAARLGAKVDTLEFDWGKPVELGKVEEKLKKNSYKIAAVVHAETSTGVRNPVEEIGKMLKGKDTIYLVDTVTSLGGIEVAVDAWGIDALYSGTQKCLSCPPGLSPVCFSEKALDVIINRKSKVPNWYLDMSMIIKYWEGKKRVYHHTAPINMLYALYQALLLVIEEEVEKVFQRHMANHKKLVEELQSLGIKMMVEPDFQLPMLNAVYVPEGANDAAIRSRLLIEHKIEIGAGLGPLAGKIWRIGLMGHTAREENVNRCVKALKAVLKR
ncbi:(S)-ureidoglycine--glyoxylate transaminase [subsurface metagenome]